LRALNKYQCLAILTILDPRFKRLHFLDKVACSYAINKITTLVNNTIRIENSVTDVEQNSSSTKTRKDFWSYHEDLINLSKLKENINPTEMPEELRFYLNQPPNKMDECPIKFWNQSNNSILSKLAKKYLSIIATSVRTIP